MTTAPAHEQTTYEQVTYERRGAAALITLNRPEKLNAWTQTLQQEIRAGITVANDDPEVGAIVLTGAGRAYCAGADISAWRKSLEGGENMGAAPSPAMAAGDSWVHMMRAAKPIIAAVNGAAIGVGVTHILPADIRIASEEARFGLAFVRAGAVPELASSWFLTQIVGLGAALELCLTARTINADEALRLGLVSRVVPGAELLDQALAMAEEIAALPPPQLRMTKALFAANATDSDADAVMAREGAALQKAYATPEFREAVMAFSEKRKPDFRSIATR